MQFAAREFPKARHLLALRTAGQEYTAISIDQRAGGNQYKRLTAVFMDRRSVAEDIVARRLEMPYGVLAGASEELVDALSDLAKSDAPQDCRGGWIIGDDPRFQASGVRVSECPTGETTRGLGGNPVAPETASNPIAKTPGPLAGIDAKADD